MSTVKRRLLDAVGVLWMLGLTIAYLSPAFKDGSDFGPADIGANMSSLTMHTFRGAYYNNLDSDIITQYQPWTIFDWNEVHHGVFPMWNYLVGTGLPQFLNFQSSPLSLSAIVGYAFPVDESLLVGVAVKMLVAGLGVYIAARVMRMSFLPALFSATTFMLSGSFSGWLGWSISGPLSWSGWLLAGCILAYRRWAHGGGVALLALSVAFSVYAGFPETSLLLAFGTGSVLLVAAVVLLHRRGLSLAGCTRVGLGTLAGLGLSAPLLVAGSYVLHESARATSHQGSGLSIDLSSLLLARGYYGLPLRGSIAWTNYYETTAYVGVLAVLFAVVAVWKCRSRLAVVGLTGGAVVSFLVIYRVGRAGPVQWVLDHVGFRQVAFQRMLPFLALCIALLAGFGIDYVLRHWDAETFRRCLFPAITLVTLALGCLWLLAITMGEPIPRPMLGKSVVPLSVLRTVRETGLYWPSVEIGSSAVLFAFARRSFGSERLARSVKCASGTVILIGQAAFLFVAGVGINTYSTNLYPRNVDIDRLTSIVGASRLGFDAGNLRCTPGEVARNRDCGVRLWLKDGFYPESNIAYGVDELGMHDPVIPQSLLDGWPVADAGQDVDAALTFDPDIDSVALAETYGVSYVLVAPNGPIPPGMETVWHFAEGTLLRVPRVSLFSLAGIDPGSAITSARRDGESTYAVNVSVRHPVTIDAAITWYPGWSATVAGKALPLAESKRGLIQFAVPSGNREVLLRYSPKGLGLGIGLAGSTVGLFGVAAGGIELRRRRSRRRARSMGASGDLSTDERAPGA